MEHTNKMAVKFREALLAGGDTGQALSAFKSYNSCQALSHYSFEDKIKDVTDMINYISGYGTAAIEDAWNKADRIEATMKRMVDALSDHLAQLQLQRYLSAGKDKSKQARGAVEDQIKEDLMSHGWSIGNACSIVADIKKGIPNLKIDYDVEEAEK